MNNCAKHCLRLKSFSSTYLQAKTCLTAFTGNFASWTRPPENSCTCRSRELFSRLGNRSKELLSKAEALSAPTVNSADNSKGTTHRTCSRAVFVHSKKDHEKKSISCDNLNLDSNFSFYNQTTDSDKCDTTLSNPQSSEFFSSLFARTNVMSRKKYGCCKFQKLYSHSHNKYQYLKAQTPHSQKQNNRCLHTSASSWSVHTCNDSVFKVRTEPPWRVLFFGTDQISVETLKRLHDNMQSSYSVVESLEVVSNIEKRQVQREVRSYAIKQGLKVYDWPIPAMQDKYDVGVLVSFGHLIPDDIIHMFPYGILNMHPSLLPRWRGASPIIHTILNGDPETGISIMEIRPKHFDIGPLLMHRRFPVPPRCTSLQLSNFLAPIGADMIVESLAHLRTLERFEEEQDRSGIRYAHKLITKNANVDWENQTCDDIDHQFRAISEVMPLRSMWRGHKVKLLDMIDPDFTNKLDKPMIRGYKGDLTGAVPGTPAYHKKLECILIKCKDGVVGFNSLSVRKQMKAKEFLGGYLSPPDGSIFESLENDLNRFVKEKRLIRQKAKM